ncbi:MAG: sulfatase-like hydrolase/transferase [Candidatus Coatesbacteria bacterium]
MPNRPHIVMFNPDQWRGDVLGHMGNPGAVTPVLDGMVRTEAVSFRYAFCQNPVCTPSRCSFMTGWYPHVNGHRTMYHMLRPHEPVLLKTLKESGYFVFWAGKNDLVPGEGGYGAFCDVKYSPSVPPPRKNPHEWNDWRGDPGGDNWFSFCLGRLEHDPATGPYEDWEHANIMGAIDLVKHPPKDRPLCLYLPLGNPHPPYAVEDPWYSMIDRAKVPPRVPTPADWTGKPSLLRGIAERQRLRGWTEDRWTELRATYYGMCTRLDHQIGMLAEAMKSAGIWDDTAFLMFSDHGDFTGDYGLVEKTQNTFEDCLTRVPLIVKPPKGTAVTPGVRDALVELVDMPATVEAFSGVAPGHTHFGRSLLPLLAGEREHRDAVFCEGGRLEGETHCAEVGAPEPYTEENLYWPRVALQASMPEHSKAVMCRNRDFKFVRRLYEPDELYDLRADPGETRNLAGDPAVAGVVAAMKERMLTFFLETGDAVPHDFNRRG